MPNTAQQMTSRVNAEARRKEIDRITCALEAEKEMLENRLHELYEEDEELWNQLNDGRFTEG